MYTDDDDDIPVAAPPPKKTKNLDSLQFLQSQIALKKNVAAQRQKPISRPSAPPPVIDLSARNKSASIPSSSTSSDSPSRFAPVPTIRPIRANPVADNISFLPKSATDDSFMMFGEYLVKNEYQPSMPNDYEKVSKAKNERKMKEKAAKEIAKRLAREHEEEDKKRSKGAAIAPPTALFEPELERSPPQSSSSNAPEKAAMPPPSFLPAFGKATSRGLGIAANIMMKHGYKEGQGLGKMEQGMSTALQVEKSGRRGGNIVAEAPKAVPTFATNSLEAMQHATKVLQLWNLMSLEELEGDYNHKDEFGEEIKGEMEKCGTVVKTIVHVNPKDDDESRQIRVFVEFTNNAHAIKAFVLMNGRYFGGRSVSAGFQDVDDYYANQF